MTLHGRNKTTPYLTGRFFDGISSGLFMMALPWLMLQSDNMGTFVALVALTCTGLSFFSTPFFSTLIDRHSRKTILVMVQWVQAICAALVMILSYHGMQSPWLLALAQLVFWVSSNLAWSTNNAFTQENYDHHEYAAISGQQEIIMQGTTLGAGALGIVLLEQWGIVEFSGFAMLASTLAGISYLVTPYRQALRAERKVRFWQQLVESRSIVLSEPRFYAFLMLSSLSYPILTYLGKLVPIWFAQQHIAGHWLAGYNMAFGIGSLLTGLIVHKLLTRRALPRTMLLAMSFSSVMVLGMSISLSPATLLVFTLLFGLFNALNRIARTNWMHHTIAIHQRGRADGALQMFATLTQSMSYVLIALLSHAQWIELGFLLAAITMGGATLAMRWLLTHAPEHSVMNASIQRGELSATAT